jgi:hypothetical protein
MCSICELRIEFGAEHPQALTVAVAARHGIDDGVLPVAAAWDRDGAIALMHGVRDRLERLLMPEALACLPPFFLLLVETGTWAYFCADTTGHFDPTVQRLPPEDFTGDAQSAGREAVLLTTETALAPMLEGRLPFGRAIRDGMLMLDARPEDAAALQAVWARSWPVSGFSRLVCS